MRRRGWALLLDAPAVYNNGMICVGDSAPTFEANDTRGGVFRLEELRGKKNVVLFFYPKAFTTVCTAEVCAFRDAYEEFRSAETEIVGVSTDRLETQERFAGAHGVPYPLLGDDDHRIADAYGVRGGLRSLLNIARRVTVVIDKPGGVRGVFRHELSAERHLRDVRALLAALRGLGGAMWERLLAPFPQGRVLYADEDVVVIDKPAGLSTSGGSDGPAGDALGRVRAHLLAVGGELGAAYYLGAPLLLERDVSGALVLVRQRRHNAPLLRALEDGQISVRYLAAASGLSPSRSLPEGVRIIERAGGRALVELAPTVPRAGAARTLLARAGGVVGGDADLRATPAPRLLLHAAALSFLHPSSGERLEISAPLPRLFRSWVVGASPGDRLLDEGAISQGLEDAAALRHGLGGAKDTDAYRLLHDEEDAVPGVAVDRYGDFAVVHLSSPEAMAASERVFDAVAALGAAGVYAKFRPRQANTIGDTRREETAPREPVRGVAAPEPLVVIERGERFLTRLGDGLSTGLFLDQRRNRALVRELSRGRRVLNLFAYSCPFTVSAALGGAASTVSVDISRSALAWGEENLRANGPAGEGRHSFVVEEARTFLRRGAVRGDRYDLIILDPPSYATTKSARFSAEHDYRDVAAEALALLAPGGHLLACTNHRGIPLARFRRFAREAGVAARRELTQVRELPAPVDFPQPPGEEPHLKSLLLAVL